MIKFSNAKYEYFRRDNDGNVTDIVEAVKEFDLEIKQGEFVAVLGRNGSGKSTLAKLINALLEPTEGQVVVMGLDVSDKSKHWDIHKNAGMVFQNPDNQIIGTIVEEDVAFGPENLGLEQDEIIKRVTESLQKVGMAAYKKASPGRLSGGQKQRVAIAGVLAMQPKCIIFDEPTAMLDPRGRKEVMRAATLLNKDKKMTVIFITHEMDEAIMASRVIVMDEGRKVFDGTPRELFSDARGINQIGLSEPFVTKIWRQLKERGINLQGPLLTEDEFVRELNRYMAYRNIKRDSDSGEYRNENNARNLNAFADSLIRKRREQESQSQVSPMEAAKNGLCLKNVSYTYNANTIYKQEALKDINLSIGKGEFICLIGHTGSGKSTLLQHLNGLLIPEQGEIFFEGKDVLEKGYDKKYLRSKVGIVFQYPEHQLFAQTVIEDVSFGPKNLGLPLLEVQQRAFEAIKIVGLTDDIYDESPFELSGGQQRRVAIAGVLAMNSEILVLDEPMAGLDPKARDDMMRLLTSLNEEGMTIILVSHNMDDVAEHANRVIVMSDGRIVMDGMPSDILLKRGELQELGLSAPKTAELMNALKENGHELKTAIYRVQDMVELLTEYLS